MQLLKNIFIIAFITAVLWTGIDLLGGHRVMQFMGLEAPKDEVRTKDAYFHHGLRPNFEGESFWGPIKYKICTDASGFKISCTAKSDKKEKSFDVAFLGDSFVEGVGLVNEDTFVGMIQQDSPKLKIANLGVVSYAPTIYLKKLEYLFSQGYQFKKIIVFIDISDIQDEAIFYDVRDGHVFSHADEPPFDNYWQYLRWRVSVYLPLTDIGVNKLKAFAVKVSTRHGPKEELPQPTAKVSAPEPMSPKDKDFPRSSWTYNLKASHYGVGGVQSGIDKSLKQMQAVYELAKKHGASLSIGVYPWPGQLLYDSEDSLQVKIWRDFCVDRCQHFYNLFPHFFTLIRNSNANTVIDQYYIKGDYHFNPSGNRAIADQIIEQGF